MNLGRTLELLERMDDGSDDATAKHYLDWYENMRRNPAAFRQGWANFAVPICC